MDSIILLTIQRLKGVGNLLDCHIHGGPTSQTKNSLIPERNILLPGVCLSGSKLTAARPVYGRAYRNKLRNSWGLFDVQDAVSGASSLVDQGLVDGNKLVIMGGSAGGFTVLKALEDYPHFFKAGVCLYGVSNHFTLAQETHKFEARYLDSLLGPLPDCRSGLSGAFSNLFG